MTAEQREQWARDVKEALAARGRASGPAQVPAKPWPDLEDAARLVVAQAEATAKQLGHALSGWLPRKPGEYWARCIQCCELAIVRHRSFSRAGISGPAATIRCRHKKT